MIYVDLLVLTVSLLVVAAEGWAFRRELREQRSFLVSVVRELSPDVSFQVGSREKDE